MTEDEEREEAFNATLRIDILKNDLAKNKRDGRFAQGRSKRAEEQLQVENNKLTSPQRRKAITWEHRVIAEAWRIFRAKQQLVYNGLLELAPKNFIGRLVLGRSKYTKSKKEKLQMRNWLDNPQKLEAIASQSKVIYKECRILREAKRILKTKQQINFDDILNAVMLLPDVPEEDAVRRCLNRNGFEGASGRPKNE